MSQILELPDPVFDALQEAATASGTTPVGWIAAHLHADSPAEETPTNGPKTLADMFMGHIGGIASGSEETLSEKCGERFTEHLLRKRREGRL
ncbi:MAG TPA: hypothetical protein VFW73_12560 [Lacipirellulaceae bacterium]|nr:hypothetical protein [Lacipirellulaceae bacterium]